MDRSSLVCGQVVKILKHGYVVRVAEGSTRLVSTDPDTLGNGPARLGEEVQCHVAGNGRASVLNRLFFFPCKFQTPSLVSASA